jgi:hypothetical protein
LRPRRRHGRKRGLHGCERRDAVQPGRPCAALATIVRPSNGPGAAQPGRDCTAIVYVEDLGDSTPLLQGDTGGTPACLRVPRPQAPTASATAPVAARGSASATSMRWSSPTPATTYRSARPRLLDVPPPDLIRPLGMVDLHVNDASSLRWSRNSGWRCLGGWDCSASYRAVRVTPPNHAPVGMHWGF